jgi:hemolysin activation/secretion protein
MHKLGDSVVKSVLKQWLALMFLALMGAFAWAQTPADLEAARRQAETLQRLEQERLRQDAERVLPVERAPQGIDTRSLVPQSDASSAGAGCHEIREIVITGAPRLDASVPAMLKSRFVGRCLGVSEIEEILGEITKAYILKGYVAARAYLPAQNLSSGRLEIMVVEGEVGSIRIEDGGKGSVSKGNAFPGVEGQVLNLRDLEQGIDQINRLASNNAQLDIQPGDKAGESVIVIRNEPRSPFHFSLSYDNQGDRNTGRHQTGASFSFDNPLGFNDFFSITHRESTPGDEGSKYSGSDSFLYSIPFGYSTLTLGKSRSRYVSTILLPSGLELVSSGNSTTSFAKLDRVVYRDQVNRATLGVTLTTKDSKNYLANQLLQVSSRDLTLLDLDASLATRTGNAALQVDAGITQGLDAFGALDDPSGLPAIAPRAQFLKYRLGLNLTVPFKLSQYDAMFTSQWAGQYAEDVLFGSEQLLIGSLYTVRGFVRNTLSGERGYYGRNELSLRFPVQLGGTTVAGRAFVALDLGEVQSRAPGTPSGRLAGSAIGFSFAWQGATWELFHTRPISGPSWMSLEGPQTWFRVSFSM